jgi:hypothetical protein
VIDRRTILRVRQARLGTVSTSTEAEIDLLDREMETLALRLAPYPDTLARSLDLERRLLMINGRLWDLIELVVGSARGERDAVVAEAAREIQRENGLRTACKNLLRDLLKSGFPDPKTYLSPSEEINQWFGATEGSLDGRDSVRLG